MRSAPGTLAGRGSTVTLTVARQPQQVTVPNTVGQSQSSALSALAISVTRNRRIHADGPVSLLSDPDVLSRTYGGHVLVIGERGVLLDDAHHHDSERGSERHFHEPGPRR